MDGLRTGDESEVTAWQDDPLFDASIVVLLLGLLLALGGGCLVLRGIKYQGRAAEDHCIRCGG